MKDRAGEGGGHSSCQSGSQADSDRIISLLYTEGTEDTGYVDRIVRIQPGSDIARYMLGFEAQEDTVYDSCDSQKNYGVKEYPIPFIQTEDKIV